MATCAIMQKGETSMVSHQEVFTIGVEEEYQIIDPVTRKLSSNGQSLLAVARQTLGKEVAPEIHLSQIEVATSICHTLGDVRAELIRLRREVIRAATHCNKKILAAASHPFSHWTEHRITPKKRYQDLEHDYQQLVREQSIFGCHVHIGLTDPTLAVLVMNHARIWLAPLLALTSNSPFWWGTDTGYASFRSETWARWPFSGPPQFFSSLDEYQALIRTLVATASVKDSTKIYWDIRIPQRYPTIEFRVMDICTTIDEEVMVAGLVRALVHTCYEHVLDRIPAPPVRQEVLRAAHWQAARYGLTGNLLDVRAQQAIPAQELMVQFLEFVRPALEAHGDWHEVSEHVSTCLEHGTGAARQRRIYQRTQHFEALVDYLIEETARDIVL